MPLVGGKIPSERLAASFAVETTTTTAAALAVTAAGGAAAVITSGTATDIGTSTALGSNSSNSAADARAAATCAITHAPLGVHEPARYLGPRELSCLYQVCPIAELTELWI